jgi:acylphosphatase
MSNLHTDSSALSSCTAIVTGKVHGVGYRNFAYSQARLCKVTGWVRNQAGGSVEIYAEGLKGNLDEFLEALMKGPKLAKVLDVAVTWGALEAPSCGEFAIKKD